MRLFSLRLMLVVASNVLATAALADALDCPTAPMTSQAVDSWRLAAATALNSGSLPAVQVAQKLQLCFGAQVPQCLTRVNGYATRSDIASSTSDLTIAQSEQKRPPAEFLAPAATGLEYVVPENLEQIANDRGWPVVRYKSRHAGGFDSGTPSLIMVLVPGDKVDPPVNYDRWLNFALPADFGADALKPLPQAPVPSTQAYAAEGAGTGQSLPRTFTMVSLDRRVGSEPGKVYFQKFFRNGSGNPIFTPQSNTGVTGCVSCHPNGLRAISPLGYHVRDGEEQLPEADWKAVELINDAMISGAGGRAVSWRNVIVDSSTNVTKPLLNTKSRSPSIGPSKPLNGVSRLKEFILGGTLPDGTQTSGCYNRRTHIDVTDIFGRAPGNKNIYDLSASPNVNWEKVADSMNCGSCHNDRTRGALNDYTSWSLIDFKILVDQSMPLGAHSNPLELGSTDEPVQDDLTADERMALTNCLQAEYELERQQLLKWMTQDACQ